MRNVGRRAPLIKGAKEISLIEKSCRIVAETFKVIAPYMKPGIETFEIDKVAEDYIRSKNANPAFKGYKVDNLVFPSTLCISINEEIVHGFPSHRKLVEGDLVSVDCGVELDGFYGDSAVSFAIGEIDETKKKLMRVTEDSLFLGISMAVANNKVYDISRAIQEHVEKNGFSITRELVGHGVGRYLHEEPAIPNFVPPLLHRNRYPNVKLEKGMTIAIEPMVHAGSKLTKTSNDGWTYVTADSMPAAHFEHTVAVDDNKAIILTLRD